MDAEAPSELLSRRHQMFPLLGDADIARMQRFATRQTAEPGTRLFTAGESAPGMFVVLSGSVEVSQRDSQCIGVAKFECSVAEPTTPTYCKINLYGKT